MVRSVFFLAAVTGAAADDYCPTSDDLLVAYGPGVQIEDGGWSIQGDGGAATKASFNLLGGFVEFDFDVSSANTGVIPNIYTVSPDGIDGGFTSDKYCDDGENDKPDCLKWIGWNPMVDVVVQPRCTLCQALAQVPATTGVAAAHTILEAAHFT
jgi:hypothetical protein